MATMTTSNPADVANRMQKYFNRKLLQHAVDELRLPDFANKAELPQKQGSNEMRFFRKRAGSSAGVLNLTEGVTPTTKTEITMEHVDVALAQIGEIAEVTDVMTMTQIFNMVKQTVQTMGEDAALKCDEVNRDAIIAGMQNIDNGQERFAGITPTGDSSADWTSLDSATADAGKWTRLANLGAVTQLKVNKAPKINNQYVCVIAPQVTHDARQDSTIETAWSRSSVNKLFKDEIGEFDGVRFVEATNPFIESTTYGTYAAAGDIFSSIYLGRDAFGCPKMAGTSSPKAPSVVILDKADKADPLNQKTVIAWKAYYNAVLLNSNFAVVLRSKSTFQ